jgi:SpoIID/LytB domain protein
MDIQNFLKRQWEAWPEVKARHHAEVFQKELTLRGCTIKVQFNPARAVSTTAKIDAASIAARPCFLCKNNRPAQQLELPWGDYTILVNPYPIFPDHLTIVANTHTPQTLKGRVEDMRRLSQELPGYAVFFNGAKAGASAPDHMHFQAVPRECISVPSCYFSYRLPHGVEPETDALLNAVAIDGEITIIPRKAHRPRCYERMRVSPGCIDVCGTLITVRREDFDAISEADVSEIFDDVTYREPMVDVGLMRSENPQVQTDDRGIHSVADVTIGVGFHWERKENQRFAGEMIRREMPDHTVQLVNRIAVEQYLRSVISSEMSATSDVELLKAHAVISRSWLLAQMRLTRALADRGEPIEETCQADVVRWYDRDDHEGFDVCADDHCQRYQGITRASTPAVDAAIAATRGLVLTHQGLICDARFSKCCGGVFETFDSAWQPRSFSYLQPQADNPSPSDFANLKGESAARGFILSSPDCFCNTTDKDALAQVLNDYDREQLDFFRWSVRYTQAELSQLVCQRSGIDFGEITDLVPLQRGASGRIVSLKIVGTRCSRSVGKELEIRRWLSTSHLRSSAFVVERDGTDFILRGAGWGHGVGLCQIGAAMMARKGYKFTEILQHYFPGTELTKFYE